MAGAATLQQTAPPATPPPGKAQGRQPVQVARPFADGAHEYTEPFLDETSAALSAATQQRNDRKVAAAGFLRGVWLLVTAAGGAGGSAVASQNGPWNVLDTIGLRDANGNYVVGPFTGYDLFLINKWGGYRWDSNPVNDPNYSAVSANGNFTFVLYLPVEISLRDGFGALPNLSSAQPFRLDYTLAANTTVFSTIPAGAQPTVNVKAIAECWSQPPAVDLMGRPIEQVPPGLGTMQFWTRSIFNVVSGRNKIELTRLGNMIRNLIFVYYDDAAPAQRTDAELPTEFRFEIDNVTIYNESLAYRQSKMRERYGFPSDTGMWVYDYAWDLDGHPGGEQRQHYIPTTGATKMTVEGNFSGTGGVLHVLTNDIAPAPSALV